MEGLMEVGIGGVVAVMVLKETFAFVGKWKSERGNGKNGNGKNGNGKNGNGKNNVIIERCPPPEGCNRMMNQVDRLVTSQQADAMNLAHTREMLEKAVERLAENVGTQSAVLQTIAQSTSITSENMILMQGRLVEVCAEIRQGK